MKKKWLEEGIEKGMEKGILLGEQKARKEARQEVQRKYYATMLRLNKLKFPLETIALAVDLPEDSVKTILKNGFKAMEDIPIEERTSDVENGDL